MGNYKTGGREYQPNGDPVAVDIYDFIGPGGKVAPYGVFDVAGNVGWVNVGTDADTGTFAVESIRRWWDRMGRAAYPGATRLLTTADEGGSGGSRLRLWKTELAAFAEQAGLQITVAHVPPGTSKWNWIEHRLFSAITMNWRGRPLSSYEVIVETIAATTNKDGLSVQAELDTNTNTYAKGIKITDKQMKTFESAHLRRHDFYGEWNYDLSAQSHTPRDDIATRLGPQAKLLRDLLRGFNAWIAASSGHIRSTVHRPDGGNLLRNEEDRVCARSARPLRVSADGPSVDKHAHPMWPRTEHCQADEPVRWSRSSDPGAPLVFPGPVAVPLTNNRSRTLRRPFAARSLRRQCCRAEKRSSRALDAVPRRRARACGLPRYAERRGPPRNRQPTVAVLVGLR